VAGQVIMDDGTESTMTKHRRVDRRVGTHGLDDEHLPGQHCPGPRQARRMAPPWGGRRSLRDDPNGQNDKAPALARKTRRGKRD